MATSFFEVLNSALQFIEDPRWQEQLEQNPAQYGRAKSQVLVNAIPRFNRPPNIVEYLKYTDAVYDDYETVVQATASEIVLPTNKKGFQLCSVGCVKSFENGNIEYIPMNNTYESSSGNVTVHDLVNEGDTIVCDFYTDGVFEHDLNATQKRILGLCVAVDWYYKFADSYMNVANLISDKTFILRSPSEHIRVNTDRMRVLEGKLSAELMSYEQGLYINQFVDVLNLPKL